MTDVELIRNFDPTAQFYKSSVDGTLCVEYRPAYPGDKGTAIASTYAARIRRFQKHGW